MPKLDLESYVPFFLSAVGNRMSRGASRTYLERFGIGVNEWRLLANLRASPGTTAGEICARSGIDKAAVSRALRVLHDRDCLEPAGDGTGDARARSLRLTPQGEALHDQVLEVALKREARLLAGFSPDEREMLINFLRRLYANIPREDDGP